MSHLRVAIALGSNLGDRDAHLQYAVTRLHESIGNLRVSAFADTAPFQVGEQPTFLNAAAVGEAALSARELLNVLLVIEAERGRRRPYPGAPRTLDLDLILHGAHIIDEPGLTIPHPRFRERGFVLEPLAGLAPDLVDPVTGRTVTELLEDWRRGRCIG